MVKNLIILSISGLVIALPFLFRQTSQVTGWQAGDPELVVITPHNEAIRFEFGLGFSQWHQQHYGKPVKIDWRSLGGTTEIMRYLEASFLASYRAYWQRSGKDWPAAAQRLMDSHYIPDGSSIDNLYQTFRSTDDPGIFSANIDVFFGGGEYDHSTAYKRGLTVPPWPEDQAPPGLFNQDGIEMIPRQLSGETWRTPTLFGVAVSTFGICYNKDRLRELGVDTPVRWDDLANPKLIGQVGVADPTKSGSIAKAYEMIIQQKIQQTVLAAGFTNDDITRFESAFDKAHGKPWEIPATVPVHYQQAVEDGWREGLLLIERIGANARYFTDSASKVPIDVSKGDAAMGLAIDFYGRYQAEYSRAPGGIERMVFVTPEGGSSVSSDPVSLMRGAPHKEIAVRFMQFLLSDDGQKLWNYRPGEVGGPVKYALRRLPIRRSFYPSGNAVLNQAFETHRPHLTDNLADPAINPYELGKKFTYRLRWTGHHFNIHRNLIKAMCLDAGEELKSAWQAIQQHGGTGLNSSAMQAFSALPDDFNWRSAIDGYSKANQLDTMRRWVLHFRQTFLKAKRLAEGDAS
ncbi:MAG: ABC transporter substrate-binding protein [Methylococcales bacterium]|nr:ABC transporter substrate-binding protein [Methylococcales bacterium]